MRQREMARGSPFQYNATQWVKVDKVIALTAPGPLTLPISFQARQERNSSIPISLLDTLLTELIKGGLIYISNQNRITY